MEEDTANLEEGAAAGRGRIVVPEIRGCRNFLGLLGPDGDARSESDTKLP